MTYEERPTGTAEFVVATLLGIAALAGVVVLVWIVTEVVT